MNCHRKKQSHVSSHTEPKPAHFSLFQDLSFNTYMIRFKHNNVKQKKLSLNGQHILFLLHFPFTYRFPLFVCLYHSLSPQYVFDRPSAVTLESFMFSSVRQLPCPVLSSGSWGGWNKHRYGANYSWVTVCVSVCQPDSSSSRFVLFFTSIYLVFPNFSSLLINLDAVWQSGYTVRLGNVLAQVLLIN